MKFNKSWLRFGLALIIASPVFQLATRGAAQNEAPAVGIAAANFAPLRPHYRLRANVDYELLTLSSWAEINIPVAPDDELRDVVFFIYANAGGVGGDDARRKNIVVDTVSLRGVEVPFTLGGAVLRVTLPQPERAAFKLNIKSHGVVPRSAPGAGGLADMMGGLGSLGGSLGVEGDQSQKPENVDYGLYTYGNGVLSLGSFWYPQLAIRQTGQWIDEAPEGLGDVAYADMSDYEVELQVPQNVTIAATGNIALRTHKPLVRRKYVDFHVENARDFAVLMSEDFDVKSKNFDVGGKPVRVTAYTLKKDAAKADKAIDTAGHALQIYARLFGPYLYDDFKVVEGTIRGGAGGMEFTGMTSVASMLYQDLGAQLGQLAGALGAGGLDQILGGFEEDAAQQPKKAPPGAQTADNPAGEMLNSVLGQQKEMFDSIFEITIAHEVAHQWWAIGVGSDSQRAPFVDESLANYTAILYFEDRYGKEKAKQIMDTHLRETYAMGRMMGGPDRPANLRTSAYAGNIQYGAVVYGKGALFYDALRRAAGDAAFFDALRTYYARYQGRIAAPRDFVSILKAKAPKANADALYARWIEQAHGDEDITHGKPSGLDDLLGGLLGGIEAE